MRFDIRLWKYRNHGLRVGKTGVLRFGVRMSELVECLSMYIVSGKW